MYKEEYKNLYIQGDTNEEAFQRLVEIVKVLRKECPWDKAQTHMSLTKCMLEEAYEVVEAINNQDIENIKEVFKEKLKIIYHTRISYPELKN